MVCLPAAVRNQLSVGQKLSVAGAGQQTTVTSACEGLSRQFRQIFKELQALGSAEVHEIDHPMDGDDLEPGHRIH
jgi:hypothetical protein